MNHEARIQGLTLKELVEIVESASDYKPEIVAFAEAELKNREIEPNTLQALTTEVRQEADQKLARQKARRIGQEKWKMDLRRFVENKNPVLLIAAIFLATIVGLSLPEDISLLKFMGGEGRTWDLLTVAAFLPTIMLISATIGLFLEKRWAWFVAALVLSYYVGKFALGVLGLNIAMGNSFLDIIFWHNQEYFSFGLFGQMMLSLAPLIILCLPRVIKDLALPNWSLALPILGFGLAFYLFGYLVETPEPIRLDIPLEENRIILDPLEAPSQQATEPSPKQVFEVEK